MPSSSNIFNSSIPLYPEKIAESTTKYRWKNLFLVELLITEYL